jgi:hypothetical protein
MGDPAKEDLSRFQLAGRVCWGLEARRWGGESDVLPRQRHFGDTFTSEADPSTSQAWVGKGGHLALGNTERPRPGGLPEKRAGGFLLWQSGRPRSSSGDERARQHADDKKRTSLFCP